MHVLTPEEIAEHIHEEHTAYSQLSIEDQKKRLAAMIQEYADSIRHKPRHLISDEMGVRFSDGVRFNIK